MHPLQIVEPLRREPFVPFRLHLSDGSSYDVRHPEFAVVTTREVAVALQEQANGELPDRMIYCDPMHVTRIEPLTASASKAGRGRRKRN